MAWYAIKELVGTEEEIKRKKLKFSCITIFLGICNWSITKDIAE